jgi:hypothetical protein
MVVGIHAHAYAHVAHAAHV